MRIGFIGRRRCFDDVRRTVFNLYYGDDGELVIADSALRIGAGLEINCDGDLTVQLFSKISEALPGAVLGVDLGSMHNGVVLVHRGDLVLHSVVAEEELDSILKSVKNLSAVAVGLSPYVNVAAVVELLKGRCDDVRSVKLIDERTSARRRLWLRRKYPGLREDEIDALSFTLGEGITLDICRESL